MIFGVLCGKGDRKRHIFWVWFTIVLVDWVLSDFFLFGVFVLVEGEVSRGILDFFGDGLPHRLGDVVGAVGYGYTFENPMVK